MALVSTRILEPILHGYCRMNRITNHGEHKERKVNKLSTVDVKMGRHSPGVETLIATKKERDTQLIEYKLVSAMNQKHLQSCPPVHVALFLF